MKDKQNGKRYGGRPTWKVTPYDEFFMRKNEELFQERKAENGWTHEKLSEFMSLAEGRPVKPQTAGDFLHGNTQPTLGRLYTAARVYGVSPAAFFDDAEWFPSLEETLAVRWGQLNAEQKETLLFLVDKMVEKNARESVDEAELELATA